MQSVVLRWQECRDGGNDTDSDGEGENDGDGDDGHDEDRKWRNKIEERDSVVAREWERIGMERVVEATIQKLTFLVLREDLVMDRS